MSEPIAVGAPPVFFACAETACHFLEAGTLSDCEKERHCPFAYQRSREEAAIDQARKDAAQRVEG